MTITETIQKCCEKMCNEYCKWPDKWNPEEHEGQELFDSEVCEHCPLNELV